MNPASSDCAYLFEIEWSGVHLDASEFAGELQDAVVSDSKRASMNTARLTIWHAGTCNTDQDNTYRLMFAGDPGYLPRLAKRFKYRLRAIRACFSSRRGDAQNFLTEFRELSPLVRFGPAGAIGYLVHRDVHPINDGGVDLCLRLLFSGRGRHQGSTVPEQFLLAIPFVLDGEASVECVLIDGHSIEDARARAHALMFDPAALLSILRPGTELLHDPHCVNLPAPEVLARAKVAFGAPTVLRFSDPVEGLARVRDTIGLVRA